MQGVRLLVLVVIVVAASVQPSGAIREGKLNADSGHSILSVDAGDLLHQPRSATIPRRFGTPHRDLAVPAPGGRASASRPQYYTAAVAQLTANKSWEVNLDRYGEMMQRAAEQGADIIVFPESGIAGGELIPDVQGTTPCTGGAEGGQFGPIMTRLSCLARAHGLVVVANLDDHQPCATRPDLPCPPTGHLNYNTQVAVSEGGEVLAKYYKEHLFDERMNSGESHFHTYPLDQDPRWFDTHFGVRFGMHLCFDIMFRTPGAALAMEPQLNITDFVFSTHWEAPGPPMLTATAAQQGWARAVGVNLLASDAGDGWHTGGSGIYSAGRVLAEHYRPDLPTSEALLVTQVPRIKAATPNVVLPDGSTGAVSGGTEAPKGSVDNCTDHARRQVAALGWDTGQVTFFDMLSAAREAASSSGNCTVHEVRAHEGAFECVARIELPHSFPAQTTPTPAASSDVYALVARASAWYGGVLPSRSCVFIRCPDGTPASCRNVANGTEPYAEGSAFWSSSEDLRAWTPVVGFEIEGGFVAGDLVMSVVASDYGRLFDEGAYSVLGGRLELSQRNVDGALPILNAMLIANTGEGPI